MSALLVWEEVPETIAFYLIPEKEAAEYSLFLEQAHDKLINCHDMNDGMRFLSAAFYGGDCGDLEPDFQKYAGCLLPFKQDGKYPLTVDSKDPVTVVYRSGFAL